MTDKKQLALVKKCSRAPDFSEWNNSLKASRKRSHEFRADLREAYLRAADLNGVDLGEVTLHDAFLSKADLGEARLRATNFAELDLKS